MSATDPTNALSSLLSTLTNHLTVALSVVPHVIPSPDGISLLDTKNDLFLAYLQNLVFFILLKIRQHGDARDAHNGESQEGGLDSDVVKKLVEFRVYLERGVRRLEGDLSYQINKVLQASDDAARASAAR